VTATRSGEVAVWDISDPEHPAIIGAPYAGSLTLGTFAFAPRTFLAPGTDLLAFDDAGNTDVWDIKSHTRVYPPLPGGAVGQTADGSTLATTGGGQVLLWDVTTGRVLGRRLRGFAPQGLGLVLFSPDGRRVAIPSAPTDVGGTVTVVDLASGAPVGDPIPGQTLRYLDDGRIAVGAGQTLELWQPDATAPAKFATPLDGAHGLGVAHWLSPTTVYGLPANLAFPGVPPSAAGSATEWDASTGKPIGDVLDGPQPPAPFGSQSIVNRDGTLAALAQGNKVELWDLAHDRPAGVFDPGQAQPVVTWDPAGSILATAGLDGTLALWDTSDAVHVRLLARATPPGHVAGAPYQPLAYFSPDGQTIVVYNVGSPQVALLSVPAASVRHVFRTSEFVGAAVFSSDSKTVAITDINFTADARVVFLDVATGAARRTLTVPYPELSSVAFVNHDQWLVTDQAAQGRLVSPESVTSRVDIWDATTLQPVGVPITVNGDAGWVEVNQPGGSRLVSSTTVRTGTDMVWDFDPAHWASLACTFAGRNLTQAEWKQYLPDRRYQITCPQWPAGA